MMLLSSKDAKDYDDHQSRDSCHVSAVLSIKK